MAHLDRVGIDDLAVEDAFLAGPSTRASFKPFHVPFMSKIAAAAAVWATAAVVAIRVVAAITQAVKRTFISFYRGHARNATRPPSIGSIKPVTQRDSSEAR